MFTRVDKEGLIGLDAFETHITIGAKNGMKLVRQLLENVQ